MGICPGFWAPDNGNAGIRGFFWKNQTLQKSKEERKDHGQKKEIGCILTPDNDDAYGARCRVRINSHHRHCRLD
jgi:hypothetical protein